MSSYDGTTVSPDTMILEVTGVKIAACDGGGGVEITCSNSPLSYEDTRTLELDLSWQANAGLDGTVKTSGKAASIARGWLKPGSEGVSASKDWQTRTLHNTCKNHGVHNWVGKNAGASAGPGSGIAASADAIAAGPVISGDVGKA